jgi:HD-like signal output (HDOD) protein
MSTGSHTPAPLTPAKIVQEVRDLPAAPKVLPKLRRLLGDDNSSLDEIVGLIRIEPGIAARLLQVSNSAIYSKGERCSSVDEAVGRVGFQGVYDMVMHAVAAQVLVRPLTTYNLESDTLWRYSVVGGLAAEMLATVTGESRETGYTLGLLHQIGMVAIDGWALRNEPTLGLAWRPFPREYTGSERALLGFTHADVGALLLQRWEFPPEMVEAIRCQYAPLDAGPSARLACLLYAAKWVRSVVCLPPGEDIPEMDPACLEPLGVDLARMQALAEEVRARAADMQDLMEIDR